MNTLAPLPPLPSIGTGLPAPAWLGTGTGQYAHYYPTGHRTSACGRSVRPERVRLAWLARHAPQRPHCPTCTRRLDLASAPAE